MIPRLKTPPVPLIELALLKEHIKVDWDTEDTTIQSYLDAAIARLDGYSGVLGRCLVSQVWVADCEGWERRILLPFPDVSAVTINYVDEAGGEQEVSPSAFEVVETFEGSSVVFRSSFVFPGLVDDSIIPITIEMTAGYADPNDVEAPLKSAILLLAAHLYQNREAVITGANSSALPIGVSVLIASYRRTSV